MSTRKSKLTLKDVDDKLESLERERNKTPEQICRIDGNMYICFVQTHVRKMRLLLIFNFLEPIFVKLLGL